MIVVTDIDMKTPTGVATFPGGRTLPFDAHRMGAGLGKLLGSKAIIPSGSPHRSATFINQTWINGRGPMAPLPMACAA